MSAAEPTARRKAVRPRRVASRRSSFVVGLLACALLTAACGARWSDDERAAVYARANGTATDASSGSTGGGSGASSTTVAGGEVATDGGSALATTGGTGSAASTGSGPATATGGTTGGATGGPAPCGVASTAPGVTKDTITVGSIATVSGPLPGLGESSLDAVRAYLAYQNSKGGVCGRKLVLKNGDDGSENNRFRSLATEFAGSTFGLVGDFAAGDGGGVDVVTSQHVPVVATAFTDSFQNAPTVFDVNPSPANPNAVIGKYRFLYAQGVRTASVATLAQAQSLSQLNLQVSQMQAAGIKVVNRQELPVSTLSFDAPARAVANSKADYFLFLGAGNLNSSMARSIKGSGYKLKFQEYLTAYGSDFIAMAGDASEGVTGWSRALPQEERGTNPELDKFLTWMGRTAPGIAPDPFAVDAWNASKIFFDNLQALPGPISRDAMIAKLKGVGTYDGDGFYGPIKLGAKVSNSCYVAMQVVGGKWKRLTPDKGFLC
jgi:ABC-type branched-subunit amino acid transport system substrate-binding protein